MTCLMGRKVNFAENNMYLRVINSIKTSTKCVTLQTTPELSVPLIPYSVCILLKLLGANFLMIINFSSRWKISLSIRRKVFSYPHVNIATTNLKSFYGDPITITSFDVIFHQGTYVTVTPRSLSLDMLLLIY